MADEPGGDRSVVDRVFDDLEAALDAAHALGLLSLDLDQLEHVAARSIRVAERSRALAARVVAEADHAGLAPRRGVGSLTAHLAAETGGASAAIAPHRTIGLWLDAFPQIAEAWARGDLTDAHVRELKKLDGPRTRVDLVRDQQIHIDSAQTLCFDDWLTTLSYWLLHADPDGALTPEREDSYGLTARVQRNGDVAVSGMLDPLTGEAFLTMVEREAQTLFRAEVDAGHDDGTMSHRRRRSIALMRLVRRGTQRPDGSMPLPLVNIVMSQRVAEDLCARMTGSVDFDPHRLPLRWDDVDRRCETIRGTPIDPRRAWPALLIGRLRRQVLNAKGRTIDLGYDTRLYTPVQKNALLVESRGHCTTIGCSAPFEWLAADHITPASKNGPTSLANGQILCNPDNRRKGDDTNS